MSKPQTTLDLVSKWWGSLDPIKQNNNLPAKGTIAGALVVLERLKTRYILDINEHRAKKGKSQIEGLGKAKVQKLLSQFGEKREFLQEGGRTNRGLAGDVEKLLQALDKANLGVETDAERNKVLTQVQEFLVVKVSEYFNRQRVKADFDPNQTAWQFIHEILEAAKKVGKEGPVAQYLVGAKLAIRFPDLNIRNDISSAQDQVSGNPGDFLVSETTFHITVAPNQGHFDKCKLNISKGLNVYFLVPDRILFGARQNIEAFAAGRITVQSVESFVSQNIEEISKFQKRNLEKSLRNLLEKYNERVDRVEIDKAMLIELPPNLSR